MSTEAQILAAVDAPPPRRNAHLMPKLRERLENYYDLQAVRRAQRKGVYHDYATDQWQASVVPEPVFEAAKRAEIEGVTLHHGVSSLLHRGQARILLAHSHNCDTIHGRQAEP